ncbi:hypothetical protein CVT26_008143 [Gymnopilus dilepis]|uniref:Uncharacterized protein n=1 Tax=Gymnopilus dilepis TaxID=231916 RepID=A0A409YRV8_9AGAR|nr:hypothetical protein CVT26_008143 [Gymnopilus dilepis]
MRLGELLHSLSHVSLCTFEDSFFTSSNDDRDRFDSFVISAQDVFDFIMIALQLNSGRLRMDSYGGMEGIWVCAVSIAVADQIRGRNFESQKLSRLNVWPFRGKSDS